MGAPATDGRGQIKRLVLIVGMGLCVPFLVFAQEADAPPANAPPALQRVDETTLTFADEDPSGIQMTGVSPFTFWDLVRMILVLGCVVGIIYVVFYLLKRAGSGKYAQNDLIKVIGSRPLPGNRGIYLVQVGTQVFMVGAGGESVTLLSEITDKETVDTLVLAAGALSPRRSFGDVLSEFLQGGQEQSIDLMRRQRERLQRLRS